MRPLQTLISIVAVVLLFPTGGNAEDRFKALAVPQHGQQENVWCWATSGQMVMNFLGQEIDQCMQVNHQLEKSRRIKRRTKCHLSKIDCCRPETWPTEGLTKLYKKKCGSGGGAGCDETSAKLHRIYEGSCGFHEEIDCCDPATWRRDIDGGQRAKQDCLMKGWPRFEDFGFEAETTQERGLRAALVDMGRISNDVTPAELKAAISKIRKEVKDLARQVRANPNDKKLSKRYEELSQYKAKESGPLTWEELTGEIEQERPVVFSWHNEDHIMVATGYAELKGSSSANSEETSRWVLINDPWPPAPAARHHGGRQGNGGDRSLISWEVYLNGTGSRSSHYRDFWKIERVGTAADLPAPKLRTVPRRPALEPAQEEAEPSPELEERRTVMRGELRKVCTMRRSFADLSGPGLDHATDAARAAVDVLRAVGYNEEFASSVMFGGDGLLSQEEVAELLRGDQLELGRALPVLRLSLVELKKYYRDVERGITDWSREGLSELFRKKEGSHSYVFPILHAPPGADEFEKLPVSSVTVKGSGKDWRIINIGRTHVVSALFQEKFLENLLSVFGESHGVNFMVYVPELYERFIAGCVSDPKKVMTFLPVYGQKFPVFEPINAVEALEILEPYVKGYRSPFHKGGRLPRKSGAGQAGAQAPAATP